MAAKTSEAMLQARKMIEAGATAYRAAKENGLTTSAVTRSPWYLARKAAQPAAVPSPGEAKAKTLVLAGMTAYRAAKLTGVSESTISRSAWYREHVGRGK